MNLDPDELYYVTCERCCGEGHVTGIISWYDSSQPGGFGSDDIERTCPECEGAQKVLLSPDDMNGDQLNEAKQGGTNYV